MKLLPAAVDLQTAAAPLAPVLRFLGLLPLANTLNGHPRRQQLHTGAVCLALSTAFLYAGYIKVSSSYSEMRTLAACVVLNDVVMFLACFANVLAVFKHRVALVRSLQELTKIDKSTHEGVCKAYRKVVLRKALYIAVTICAFSYDVVFELYFYGITIGFVTLMLLLNVLFLKCVTTQFVLWLTIVKLELRLVNGEFLNVFRWLSRCQKRMAVIELNPSLPKHKSQVLSRITHLRFTHLRLFKLAYAFDTIYGIPLVLSVTSIFLNAVYYLYVSNLFFPNSSVDDIGFEYINVIGFVLPVVCVIAIMVLELAAECSHTRRAYQQTAILIQEMLLDGNKMDADIREALSQFESQVVNLKMKFTPGGFFELNFGLVASMVGYVTTYLVVLVQFQR